MNKQLLICLAFALSATAMLTGCASTQVTGEWRNPDVKKAGPYEKIFITAITGEETVRRQAEDAFKTSLAADGVTGIPSYDSLPKSDKAERADLGKAVKSSGADGALVIRMVKKESKVAVTPTYYGPTGYYGGYYDAWDDFYAPTSVYQYDVVTLEAKLYDVAKEKLVWAVSTETTDPGKIQKEIKAYANLVCESMVKAGMIAAPAH